MEILGLGRKSQHCRRAWVPLQDPAQPRTRPLTGSGPQIDLERSVFQPAPTQAGDFSSPGIVPIPENRDKNLSLRGWVTIYLITRQQAPQGIVGNRAIISSHHSCQVTRLGAGGVRAQGSQGLLPVRSHSFLSRSWRLWGQASWHGQGALPLRELPHH